jgi:hypothetical protein
MSYVLNNDAGKSLSATLTGTTIACQTHNRLITLRIKYTSVAAFDIVTELSDGANIIQNLNTDTTGTEAYFTPDGFTTEWSGVITPAASTGSWLLQGCYMQANSNGVSRAIKQYRNTDTGPGTTTGTATTGNMMNLIIGHAAFPPDILICEYAIWLVANEAAADAIIVGLYGGGFQRKADAIGHIAQPDYYWPLLSDLAAVRGSPTLTNTGSVASSTDMPTLRPRGRTSLLGAGCN